MRIGPISNTNFQAGKVKLTGLTKENLFLTYDEIEKIAKKEKIDFAILKHPDSKYLPTSNMYTIIASKEVKKPPFILHGIGVSIISKNAEKEIGANRFLSSLEKAVNELKEKISL